MDKTRQKWMRIGVIILAILAVIFFYKLRGVLWPFVFAFFIAYILNPWVNFFQRRRISRPLSVVLVFVVVVVLLIATILILVPQILKESDQVRQKLPHYIEVVRTKLLPRFQHWLELHPDIYKNLQQYYENALKPRIPTLLTPVLRFLGSMFSGFVNFIVAMLNVLLVPVLAFYMLSDFPQIKQRFLELFPHRHQSMVLTKIGEVDDALGGYLRGQLTVSLCLAIIYIIGLLVLGVPLAIPIGLFSGLANMVPDLGIIMGISVSFLLSFVDNQDWHRLVWIVVVYTFAQVMEGVVISPLVVGKRTGLHPVVIMLALVVGGTLFGFMGMILAVPVFAMASVFIKSAYTWYLSSEWYLERKSPKPTIAE
ncbi:MAG TPA: AI-2E family transporter [Acidobacteriota bacterium]|nr:AI-2E family transporter [Acidobacteriota bacterium]